MWMSQTIIWTALFASIFGIVFVLLMTRNKERMALIEKGADASLFYSEKEVKRFNWSKFILKVGMFFMGVALGVFLAALWSKCNFINAPALYISLIFFFSGLSLVLSYLIDRKSK